MDKWSGWALVGKLGAALVGTVAVVVGVTEVYSAASAPQSDLRAEVQLNRFALPPPVILAVRAERDGKIKEAFQKALGNSTDKPSTKELEDSKLPAKGASFAPLKQPADTGDAEIPEGIFESGMEPAGFNPYAKAAQAAPESLETFAHIEVVNEGSLVAEEVSLKLPDTFQIFSVVGEDGKVSTHTDARRAQLGSIRPRQSAIVLAWSVVPLGLSGVKEVEEGTTLSYSKGIGEVSMVLAPGFHRRNLNKLLFGGYIALTIWMLGVLIFLVWHTFRSNKKLRASAP